jgi:type IV pilus assembly protein PilE
MRRHSRWLAARARRAAGFTLVELMAVVAIVAILAAVAIPSYSNYVVRSSRSAAQTELLELAAAQERIFLNSGAYTANLATAYTGLAAGGLGIGTGKTRDGRYTLAVTLTGTNFYTATATPVSGTPQAGDGTITLTSAGARTWNGKSW